MILAATQWVSSTLLGSLATSIAAIAIAWVGLMMLSGQIDLRRGLTVVLGSFILFGAPSIARGLRGLNGEVVSEGQRYVKPALPSAAALPPAPPSPPNSYDPYAGASLRQ